MSFYQKNSMLQIDSRIDDARIRQFASEARHISPRLLHLLRESLLMGEGQEFYRGQLAALQYAHQLAMAAKAPHAQTLGCVIAVVSENIVNKGWLET